MATYQYSLLFQNNSSNSGTVCVYQLDPGLGVPGAFSLAWQTNYNHPTTNVVFQWNVDYDFVWFQSGKLGTGTVFLASQVWPTDGSTNNQITLTKQGGAYTFSNQTKGAQAGILYIHTDDTIPAKEASTGIGMSGTGTFVTQAQPNWNLQFTPSPQYWIAFGSYTQGQVLGSSALPGSQQVVYGANVYSMTAILNSDNSWTIQPTAQTSTAAILSAQPPRSAG